MEHQLEQEIKSRKVQIGQQVKQFLLSVIRGGRLSVDEAVTTYEAVYLRYGPDTIKQIHFTDLRNELNNQIRQFKKETRPVAQSFSKTENINIDHHYHHKVVETTPTKEHMYLNKNLIVSYNTGLKGISNPHEKFRIQICEGAVEDYIYIGDTNKKRREVTVSKLKQYAREGYGTEQLIKRTMSDDNDQDDQSDKDNIVEIIGMIVPIQAFVDDTIQEQISEQNAGILTIKPPTSANGKEQIVVYKLIFIELSAYNLFSGQIIKLKGQLKNKESGSNQNLGKLFIHQIVRMKPLVTKQHIKLSDKLECWNSSDGVQSLHPMKLLVATGPYFKQSEMNLDIMKKIGQTAKKRGANAVMLLGPFLPKSNKVVEEGLVYVIGNDGQTPIYYTYQEYLRVMLDTMEHAFDVIIVPSCEDISSTYPLPQPPFMFKQIKQSMIHRRKALYTIPNPSSIVFNDVLIGIINSDVVKDLVINTLNKQDKSPIKAKQDVVLQFLFQSNSFYPLLQSASSSQNLVSYLKWEDLKINEMPDLIIAPSNYPPFVKTMNERVMSKVGDQESKTENCMGMTLNPLKAIAGGLIQISIQPPSDDNEVVAIDRLKVETVSLN